MRSALFSTVVLAAALALCPAFVTAAATKRHDNPPGPQPSQSWPGHGNPGPPGSGNSGPFPGKGGDGFRVGTVIRKRDGSLQLPVVPPEADISPILCPLSMAACPISEAVPTSLEEWVQQGFECVDLREDLTSCGGCGAVDVQHDCTAIPNALGVSCEVGTCRVQSCRPGFTPALDGKGCISTA